MARRAKTSRAVFGALSGIPMSRYTARTAVHTGFVSGLHGLFCAAIAPAHTISPTPTRTRARSTMLNPRRITLVGTVALLLGSAALVNAVLPGAQPQRTSTCKHTRSHTHARSHTHTHIHTHTRTTTHTYAHWHTRGHTHTLKQAHTTHAHALSHIHTTTIRSDTHIHTYTHTHTHTYTHTHIRTYISKWIHASSWHTTCNPTDRI
jgi:hypothetical protein